MDWGKLIMDTVIASLITGIFAVVAVLVTNGYTNKKGYEKLDSKIGDLGDNTLNRQHEEINNSIRAKTENMEKAIMEKTSNIYTKVDSIDKITVKNEALYENLNQNQKEVRNNVNKLVLDWERTISENKELKAINKKLLEEVSSFKENRFETKIETKDIKEKLDKLISINGEITKENQELKSKITKLEEENNNLYSKINESDCNNEDDWNMEI